MNLKTMLPEPLWDAVHTNYEKRNFSGAILDAFYFLSELLRNKSATEGDGASLIGQAFGGAAPKIKLNRLQTESERNVQRGMELLLRGLYQCIRNPRSHDKISDSEEDAQVLILFVGYLIRQIDRAKSQFSRSDFIRRVLDPDFVPSERYASLLVSDIPVRSRLDVFLDLFGEVESWKPEHMRVFLTVLLKQMKDDEVQQVCDVLTDELGISETESRIRIILGSFPPLLWPRIGEVARLRIENKVIRSVRDGKQDMKSGRCRDGALGTWSTGIFPVMTLKSEMVRTITSKIFSGAEDRAYVFRYLFNSLHNLSDTVPRQISSALCSRLKAGDTEVYEQLGFAPPWDEDKWPEDLKKAYSSFKASEPIKTFDDDDIPF